MKRKNISILVIMLIVTLVSMFSACDNSPPHGMTLPSILLPNRTDFITVKYDANGNQVWTNLYNILEDSSNKPVALNSDNSGNAYVTSASNKDLKHQSLNTVKYDSSGKQIWVATYNNPEPDGTLFASAATVDNTGNIYVTGNIADSKGNGQIVTIKYDSNVNQVWVALYHHHGSNSNGSSAIVLDEAGNIYITGNFYFNYTDINFLTLKYNNRGDLLWVATYDGPFT